MATRGGYLVATPDQPFITGAISTNLDEYAVDYATPRARDLPSIGMAGRQATFPVTSHAGARSGYSALSYFDDYYNRIHVKPLVVDFGNITPPQSQTIEVWNAYLVPKSLTAIVAAGDASGLTLDPAPPMTFQPLQSVVFTLTAGPDVANTVNVVYTFEFTGITAPTLSVTGTSVIPAPWCQAEPLAETLEWLTDLMTAQDGSEQAVSLREAPRQMYSVTMLTRDFSGAQHAFVGGYGRGFAVPMMAEGQPCSVSAGATEILLDTTQGDWRESVMIWVDEDNFEIIEIDSELPDRLLLKRPVATSRTGQAFPTATARLIADPVRTTNGFSGSIQANFQFTDGRDLASGASAVQWGGYDVLLQAPRLAPVNDTLSQRIEVLDNATGWGTHDRYWPRAKITRPMRWVVDRTELWALRQWLHRRRGQALPFYQPSFERDFTLAGLPGAAIGSTLIVAANGYESQGKTRALALRTASGYVFADIIGVADNGATIGLALAQTLAETYGEIQQVSLMGLKRLAADRVQINHRAGGKTEVTAWVKEYQ